MKTSFSTLACPDWNLAQIIAGAVRYGFDGIELRGVSRELDLWKLPEFSSPSLPETKRLIADQALTVACIGSSAVFHSADPAKRQENVDLALRMAEIAAALGAPAIRVFGDRVQPGNTHEQTAVWIADTLLLLAEKLASEKVEVWLETHGDFATAVQVRALLHKVPSAAVGVIWDPANAFAQENEAPTIAALIAGRIRHVHLKDLVRTGAADPIYVLTGEGDFSFDTMFSALKQIDFDRFVSFEWEKLWHPELASPEIALPHFMHWWKNRASRVTRNDIPDRTVSDVSTA